MVPVFFCQNNSSRASLRLRRKRVLGSIRLRPTDHNKQESEMVPVFFCQRILEHNKDHASFLLLSEVLPVMRVMGN